MNVLKRRIEHSKGQWQGVQWLHPLTAIAPLSDRVQLGDLELPWLLVLMYPDVIIWP
jgi:hypothetical protein